MKAFGLFNKMKQKKIKKNKKKKNQNGRLKKRSLYSYETKYFFR